MSGLPQPPAPHDLREADMPETEGGSWMLRQQMLMPGQLTHGWRAVFLVGWGCVVLAYAAVWRTSRTMGLSTWWLGATSTPQFILVQLLPFMPSVAMVLLGARNARHLPWFGIAAGAALAAVGAGDLGRFERLALVELAIAAAAVLISTASFAGMLQPGGRVQR